MATKMSAAFDKNLNSFITSDPSTIKCWCWCLIVCLQGQGYDSDVILIFVGLLVILVV